MAELQMLLEEESRGLPGPLRQLHESERWLITARTTTSRCDASAGLGVVGPLAAERRVGDPRPGGRAWGRGAHGAEVSRDTVQLSRGRSRVGAGEWVRILRLEEIVAFKHFQKP